MAKRAYIFDLEGVILHIRYENTFEKLAKYGIKVNYDAKFKALVEQYDKGEINTRIMYENFCSTYCSIEQIEAGEFTEDHFKDAWNSMLLYIPDESIDYLFTLKKKKDVILVVLSNINELHLQCVLYTHGKLLENLFDKCFFSFEINSLKPSKDSFNVAINYLIERGIKKSNINFVDDDLKNITACGNLGIKSIHYPKNGLQEDTQKHISICSILNNSLTFFQSTHKTFSTSEEASVEHDVKEITDNTSELLQLPLLLDSKAAF